MRRSVALVTPPTRNKLIRCMAGGLGFGFNEDFSLPPLELMHLAAALRREWNVVIIDANARSLDLAAVKREVRCSGADTAIVALSLPTLAEDCTCAQELSSLGIRVVGKTNIRYWPVVEDILRKISECIIGECETTVEDVLAGRSTLGLVARGDLPADFRPAPPVGDLDEILPPDRALLSIAPYSYSGLGPGVSTILGSRGCPFPCATYCPYPLVQGDKLRVHSPGRIARELGHIVSLTGARAVLFRDALFTADGARCQELCDVLVAQKPVVKWWCETRVDLTSEGLLEQMAKAGCVGLNVGVESGDESFRGRVTKRGLSDDRLSRFMVTTRRFGLKVCLLVVVGFPGESKPHVVETWRLIASLRPFGVGVSVPTPYPGTELFAQATAKGWIESFDWGRYTGRTPVMHTDEFSTADMAYARDTLMGGFGLLQSGASAGDLNRVSRDLEAWAGRPQPAFFRAWPDGPAGSTA